MPPSNEKWGTGMTQEDMMIKDECILVDNDDHIIGHASKRQAHTFTNENPRGQVHRAFSVFLFNDEGKLLLQQRAADKITFPNVWTNTCCSHQLYGFQPSEVDNDSDIANGSVFGAKNAAIRKLEHELGIPASSLHVRDFKFLTRLHYWAADVVTHGKTSPWGEHEIDYILFIQKNVTLSPNAEEVSNTRYVSLDELQGMMDPSSGLLWSPWFRIIAQQFLVHWWKDLRTTLTTDAFVDTSTIYRFDPTEEHMGGAGNAFHLFGKANLKGYGPKLVGNQALKQGAYGKVKIHGHSKWDQFSRIDEVFAAVWFKLGGKMVSKVDETNDDVRFCNDMLGRVSRSFAEVIRQLPRGLCIDILIFYLALRALDTIEDDMTAFKGRETEKFEHLNNFYRTGLVTEGWTMSGVGSGDEATLLEQYDKVVRVFKALPLTSQVVIADITRRMGEGMTLFAQRDLGQGTVTVEDYNLYCHYVAGLVGEGLTRLFASTGYESKEVEKVSTTLANTMGLFLQKTNIIRDYLEDYVDGRAFWPQQIWKQYSKHNDLGEFSRPEAFDRSLSLLNHLVTDALHCVPECVEYMSMLKTEEVFRFCAIPQVMAIATLGELYNNPKVFTGVVKIRKGLAVKLILDTTTVGGLHKWFYLFAKDILSRVPDDDINAQKTRDICNEFIRLTRKEAQTAIIASYAQVFSVVAALVLVCTVSLLKHRVANLVDGTLHLDFSSLVPPFSNSHGCDLFTVLLFYVCAIYIFAYGVISSGRSGLKKADK